MGGTQAFTGDLGSDLNASSYALERTLAASTFASRARALGMTAFLGFYLVNYENVRTPLAEWFDDAAWSQTVLPDVRGLGAAAKALGFGGVAFDQELYTQKGPASTASWNWDYPGNVHSEQAVRKEVSLRGQQLMTALLQGFPGVSIVAYNTLFPGTWDALVQQVGKGLKDPYGQTVQTNFLGRSHPCRRLQARVVPGRQFLQANRYLGGVLECGSSVPAELVLQRAVATAVELELRLVTNRRVPLCLD